MTKFTAYIYLLLHKKCKGEVTLEFDHYGGSTTNWKKRDTYHRIRCSDLNDPKSNYKVYQYIREHGDYDNWEMVLVETVEVESKQELRKIEAYWIKFTGATLNQIIPGRTPKEYLEQNKEKILERKKKHYEQNKAEINAKKREKYTCECGLTLAKGNKWKHEKSQKHQDYLKHLDSSHASTQ